MANNLGFAIPVDIVKNVTQRIINEGRVHRSWIGVDCQALQELENWFGTDGKKGVLIASVSPGSPADKKFLKAGDIILAVDGDPVSARFTLTPPFFATTLNKSA